MVAPSLTTLPPQTTLGEIALTVPNLDRSVQFYTQTLGFQIHHRQTDQARLGAGHKDIIVLIEDPEACPAKGMTGLYHMAILVPSRLQLAISLERLLGADWRPQGFAHHGVSEAIYLADPDGIGIEIYRDLPKTEWPYRNGQLQMVSERLDVPGLLAELPDKMDLPEFLDPDTRLGHVHLKVSDIAQTEAFYSQHLGFDLIQRYGPSARFFSAGGYHHHIGANTWESLGASSPPPHSTGLQYFCVLLPDRTALDNLRSKLAQEEISTEIRPDGFLVRDPAGNSILWQLARTE